MIALNTSRTGCSALTLKLLYNSLYTQYGIASVLHKSHCRYTVNHTLSVVHEKCSCEVIENSQRLKSSSKCKRAVTFGLKQTCTEQKIDTTLWYLYSPVPSVSKSGPIMFFLIICLILLWWWMYVKVISLSQKFSFRQFFLFFAIFWISLIDTPTCCKTSLQGAANQEQLGWTEWLHLGPDYFLTANHAKRH